MLKRYSLKKILIKDYSNGYMKKYLLLTLIFVSTFFIIPVTAQKVTINLNRSEESSMTFWHILDEDGLEVISANNYMNEDSLSFSLTANNLFSLRIIVTEPVVPSPLNYTLGINGEDILRINEQLPTGEHEFKFFTGLKTPVSKIVGGSNASIADFPWQVYFKTGKYVCGATIIAPEWVITAAHCTVDENNNQVPIAGMTIVAGSATPLIPDIGKTYQISQVIAHEEYNRLSFENDIALLKLSEPINIATASPIKLISTVDVNDGCTAPGVMSLVTGWGYVSVAPPTAARTLQKALLPIVSNDQASLVCEVIPRKYLMAGYR
jgi:hypothetical protein